jgi:hypothetical protein
VSFGRYRPTGDPLPKHYLASFLVRQHSFSAATAVFNMRLEFIPKWLALVLACLCLDSVVLAAEPDPDSGSSSAQVRRTAVQRIPFQKLNAEARQKLSAVVDHPSIFRRMPTETITCDPELFIFLVRYPEVLVNLWELMGVTKVTVDRIAPLVFRGEDGAGTKCQVELVYGTENLHIYYGTGTYEGVMANRGLNGRCVCVLQSFPSKNKSGETQITGQMDVFLKLDNVGADIIAKTLAPFVGKTADYNFVESARFVSQLSQAASRNPIAVQQVASRMNNIQPSVRQEFIAIAGRMAARNSVSVEEAVNAGHARTSAASNATLIDFESFENRTKVPAPVAPAKTEVIMRR